METAELIKEDYKNIIVFMNRNTDINGTETTVHAILLQKLATIYENMDKVPDVKAPKQETKKK